MSDNEYRIVKGLPINRTFKGLLRISPTGPVPDQFDVLTDELTAVSDSAGNDSGVTLSLTRMGSSNTVLWGDTQVVGALDEAAAPGAPGLTVAVPSNFTAPLSVDAGSTFTVDASGVSATGGVVSIGTGSSSLRLSGSAASLEGGVVTLRGAVSVKGGAADALSVSIASVFTGGAAFRGGLAVEGGTLSVRPAAIELSSAATASIVDPSGGRSALPVSRPEAAQFLLADANRDWRLTSFPDAFEEQFARCVTKYRGALLPYTLFDVKWSDKFLADGTNWLLSTPEERWYSADDYPRAWNRLVEGYAASTAQEETIPLNAPLAEDRTVFPPDVPEPGTPAPAPSSVEASYRVDPNGMRIVYTRGASERDNSAEWWSRLLEANGTSWYYVIDAERRRFLLPRTRDAVLQFGDGSRVPGAAGVDSWSPEAPNGRWVRASLPDVTGTVYVRGNAASFEDARGAFKPTAAYVGERWGCWSNYGAEGVGPRIDDGAFPQFSLTLVENLASANWNGNATARVTWNRADFIAESVYPLVFGIPMPESAKLCSQTTAANRTELLFDARSQNPVYGRGSDAMRSQSLNRPSSSGAWLPWDGEGGAVDPASDDPNLVQPKAVAGLLYFYVGEGAAELVEPYRVDPKPSPDPIPTPEPPQPQPEPEPEPLDPRSLLPVGSVVAYAGRVVPEGWLPCDGASLRVDDYPDLYAQLGDIHGEAPAGRFRVPDLTGVFVKGAASADAVGVREDAYAPNIVGEFPGVGCWLSTRYIEDPDMGFGGAFALSEYSRGQKTPLHDPDRGRDWWQNGINNGDTFAFDASRCSAVYKEGAETLAPANCALYYIIKARHVL